MIIAKVKDCLLLSRHFSKSAAILAFPTSRQLHSYSFCSSASPNPSNSLPFPFPSHLPYDIVFPETSNLRLQSLHSQRNSTTSSNNKTIIDIESHIRQIIRFAADEIAVIPSKADSHNNADLSYVSLKRKDPAYQNQRIESLSRSSSGITKNLTPAIIDSMIELLNKFNAIPREAKPAFIRQTQICLKHVFYMDFEGQIEFEKIRKVLFLAIRHNLAIPIPLVTIYFSYLDTSNPSASKPNQQLKFDNLIDIIIALHIMKVHHSSIQQISFVEQAVSSQLNNLLDGVLAKKIELRFPQFLAVFNAAVQLSTTQDNSAEQELSKLPELTQITEKMSQLIQQTFYQISSAESKIEVVTLLAMLNKPDVVDFLLPHLQNQIKSNLDMLELTEEQLQLICQYISRIKANHSKFHHFITSVLVEQEPNISSKCLSNLLNVQNQIATDVPYALKNTLIKIVASDHNRQNSIAPTASSAAVDAAKSLAHPTLKYRLGFQQKLSIIMKMIGHVHIPDSLFINLISDFQNYDSETLSEELGFAGVAQTIFTCTKLRMSDSPLFERFESHVCDLLERLKFESKQLQFVLNILSSYASSTHTLSKRFVESSIIFLINSLPRIETRFHGSIYTYLAQILMRAAEGDFDFEVSSIADHGIQRILKVLTSNEAQVLDSIENLEIKPAFSVHQLFSILKSSAYEELLQSPAAAETVRRLSETILSEEWTNKCSAMFNQHSQGEIEFMNEILLILAERFPSLSLLKDSRIGIYQCDILIRDINVIVNLNGPTQYILASDKILEKNRLKNYIFKSQGFHVIDVKCGDIKHAILEQRQALIDSLLSNVSKILIQKQV